MQPDGSMQLPDGSVRLPDGRVRRPDGSYATANPDGSYPLADGRTLLPDGCIRYKNGNVLSPSGHLQYPDGRVQMPDGDMAPPGYHVPTASLPGFTKPQSAAVHELDMADGVLDGKYFGQDIIPEGSVTRPDGTVRMPNGMVMQPDGSMQLPDGSVRLPDGRVRRPDGSYATANPDGSYPLAHGHTLMSNGDIRKSDGTLLTPSGHVKNLDGSVVLPNGVVAPSGYTVPEYALPSFTKVDAIVVPTQDDKDALDMADGVMDGKFHGKDIRVAPGVDDGDIHVSAQDGNIHVSSQAAANALDAADGVLDGKYHGQSIKVDGPGTQVITASSEDDARAIDAADGVIDGKFNGRNIRVQPRSSMPQSSVFSDRSYYSKSPSNSRLSHSSVGYHPRISYAYPERRPLSGSYVHRMYGDSATLRSSRSPGRLVEQELAKEVKRFHQIQGLKDQLFDLQSSRILDGSPAGTHRSTHRSADDLAEDLDAADGIMDGKFFGRDIVVSNVVSQRSTKASSRQDLAAALDAADGVMDGKFFGKDIVVADRPRHRQRQLVGYDYRVRSPLRDRLSPVRVAVPAPVPAARTHRVSRDSVWTTAPYYISPERTWVKSAASAPLRHHAYDLQPKQSSMASSECGYDFYLPPPLALKPHRDAEVHPQDDAQDDSVL